MSMWLKVAAIITAAALAIPAAAGEAAGTESQAGDTVTGQCWRDGELLFSEDLGDSGDPEFPQRAQDFYERCRAAGGVAKFVESGGVDPEPGPEPEPECTECATDIAIPGKIEMGSARYEHDGERATTTIEVPFSMPLSWTCGRSGLDGAVCEASYEVSVVRSRWERFTRAGRWRAVGVAGEHVAPAEPPAADPDGGAHSGRWGFVYVATLDTERAIRNPDLEFDLDAPDSAGTSYTAAFSLPEWSCCEEDIAIVASKASLRPIVRKDGETTVVVDVLLQLTWRCARDDERNCYPYYGVIRKESNWEQRTGEKEGKWEPVPAGSVKEEKVDPRPPIGRLKGGKRLPLRCDGENYGKKDDKWWGFTYTAKLDTLDQVRNNRIVFELVLPDVEGKGKSYKVTLEIPETAGKTTAGKKPPVVSYKPFEPKSKPEAPGQVDPEPKE